MTVADAFEHSCAARPCPGAAGLCSALANDERGRTAGAAGASVPPVGRPPAPIRIDGSAIARLIAETCSSVASIDIALIIGKSAGG